MWKTKDKNCGTLSIDLVQVEIPQHPVDLHSIVTVTTKELSSTLQEFRGTILQQRGKGRFTCDVRIWLIMRLMGCLKSRHSISRYLLREVA